MKIILAYIGHIIGNSRLITLSYTPLITSESLAIPFVFMKICLKILVCMCIYFCTNMCILVNFLHVVHLWLHLIFLLYFPTCIHLFIFEMISLPPNIVSIYSIDYTCTWKKNSEYKATFSLSKMWPLSTDMTVSRMFLFGSYILLDVQTQGNV
jgi:hypothetical protein